MPLKVVEIEIAPFCNRTCWFCPNSFSDRRSPQMYAARMDTSLYLSVLAQLREIGFAGDVTYSRYNEPTAHKELFLERLRQARFVLPTANLKTNSNGDYIDRAYLCELRESGLNELFLQDYDLEPFAFDYPRHKARMERKIAKLGAEAWIIHDDPARKLEYRLDFPGMRVHLRARNFNEDGSSRGNTIPLAMAYTRTQRCLQPSENCYIDWTGKVMVCCALRSDIPSHADGIMGDLNTTRLEDVLASPGYDSWRRHHETDGPKEGVCKTCRDNVTT